MINGEVILHAASDLTDATLNYLQRPSNNNCPALLLDPLDPLETCEDDLTWTAWAGFQDIELVPIVTLWDIREDDLVRFDVSDYLRLDRYKCGWNSYPFEFAITSTDPADDRGFYSTEGSGQAPRLAFLYGEDETINDETSSTKCSDCIDNNCDGDVDCDDDCDDHCSPP